jgi:hypothetical protein
MEYTSPGNPGRLHPSSVVPVPWREKPKCLPDSSLLVGLLHYCAPLATTRILGSYKPLYSARLPALRQIDFGLSGVPYWGNVVARVNCSERTLSDHQCHLKNHQLLYPPWSSPFVQNHFFWKHFSGVDTTPRFLKAFSKLSLSVPNPRVFWLH